MYSKAKIAGHPVHPMLVAFPIAFYTATLVAFLVYWSGGNPMWFRIGVIANIAGVAMALVAAIPGFIDWAFGIPGGTPAKITGLQHMLLNVSALMVFAINALVQTRQWNAAVPAVGVSVDLPLIGLAISCVGGWLGWALTSKHHVGIELSAAQELLEPVAGAVEPSAPSATRPAHQH